MASSFELGDEQPDNGMERSSKIPIGKLTKKDFDNLSNLTRHVSLPIWTSFSRPVQGGEG